MRKFVNQKKSQGHRGHRKVKCEISQALVMINLYVKFNVHSTYAKQETKGRTGGRTSLMMIIGIRQNFG